MNTKGEKTYFLIARLPVEGGKLQTGQVMLGLGQMLFGWDQNPPIPVSVQVDKQGGLHISSAERGAVLNAKMESVDEQGRDQEQILSDITDQQGLDLSLNKGQQLIITNGKGRTVRIYP